jgi:membrane fusion protein, multidrug efflux system
LKAAALLAPALLAALACSCSTPDAQPAVQNDQPLVTVTRPRTTDVTRTVVLPGDLVGFNEAALYAKVTGYLERIDVDKGDTVKKGQVLATIEVPELEQKLKRARANLETRHVTYERLKSVWDSDKRLVAREDVDIALGSATEAKAEVEELEAMVGYTQITAPFDGVITARYVDPGALIEADGHGSASPSSRGAGGGKSPVVSLADISRLRVYVYVPEEETSLVKQGTPAMLRLREFPGREFTGKVARFAHALDLSTRTMLAEIDLPNPSGELYPGMYADVSLELERHQGALEIPTTAVQAHAGSKFVWAVRDGTLARVPIETGISAERGVEVTSGLTPTDEIVRNANPSLREGEKVRTVDAPEAAEAPATAG